MNLIMLEIRFSTIKMLRSKLISFAQLITFMTYGAVNHLCLFIEMKQHLSVAKIC